MFKPKFKKGSVVRVKETREIRKIVSIIPMAGAFFYELEGLEGFYAENELQQKT